MTDISRQVQQRAAAVPADDLLRRMGYHTVGPKARNRLSRVLADPELGLSTPDFDFHLASRGFAEALCAAAGLEPERYLPAIDTIERRHHEEAVAYKPWLFVDTGFKRSDHPGSPRFALAAMEAKRRVRLPADTCRLPWEQQLQRAQQTVRWHMRETGGELPLWGHIHRYLFWYAEDRAVELTLEGDVAGEASPVGLSRASLSVNRRPIVFSGSEANDTSPGTGDPYV